MAIYNNAIDPNILMWETLEKERQKTLSDPKYREWVKQLNVSQSYQDKTPIIKAMDLLKQYDYSEYKFLGS